MSIRNDDSRFLLGTPISDHREREREREREAEASTSRRFRTLLHLLSSDKSDDGDGDDDRTSSRWRAVKERVGFTLPGCCGCATWRRRGSPSPPALAQENNVNEGENGAVSIDDLQENGINPGGMNLAEALAAEREFRLVPAAETPERVSLMRLLQTAEREREEEEEEEEEEVVGGNDRACCVCMVRKKGTAIIPCGHTLCRICAKEVWANRGSCPLCNRLILDLLNIF